MEDDQRFNQELFTEESRNIDYCPVSYRDSETHALQNGNLERHEVFKIDDRVQCQICFKYQRPGETFCACGCILECINEEVKKQAEQSIHDACSWHSQFSIEK